ncbi:MULTISPECIES: hypothetical protein [unclassified Parvimonas]|jgi:hypothetical protein|uniref:hypothetical protein n=1 Tax=unclassified Parvimonas TaxID=1151464 RepID=UPI002B4A9917|nr:MULTISPECIES: hypothetical protein [unclassified Parvimonas]MEB3025315.1 hypothetical protein [Parvimonas sp. M13]MEB3072746.1 hypothetical protein [Parvimonas sp. C2]MEB3089441.1 hypothetical protein [Parvimonas sp. M20]
MKKNIKNVIILVFIIEFVGLGLIFYRSSVERGKIRKEREKYYIVTDINHNDVLKIEKKYLSSQELNKIVITKVENDKKYIIEEKKLMDDVISKLDFNKFISNSKLNMGTEDITISFESNNNTLSITLSAEDRTATLKYNDYSFTITVSDEFYNFIYELYSRIS